MDVPSLLLNVNKEFPRRRGSQIRKPERSTRSKKFSSNRVPRSFILLPTTDDNVISSSVQKHDDDHFSFIQCSKGESSYVAGEILMVMVHCDDFGWQKSWTSLCSIFLPSLLRLSPLFICLICPRFSQPSKDILSPRFKKESILPHSCSSSSIPHKRF